MRGSWTRRVLSALVAGWFIVAGALIESPAVHRCSMHDGRLVSLLLSASAHGERHASSSHPDHHEHPHGCTCLGDCGAAPTLATPAAPIALGFVPESIRQTTLPAEEGRAPTTRPHTLPFANGPPHAPVLGA